MRRTASWNRALPDAVNPPLSLSEASILPLIDARASLTSSRRRAPFSSFRSFTPIVTAVGQRPAVSVVEERVSVPPAMRPSSDSVRSPRLMSNVESSTGWPL